jgi:hypothetical protein
MKKLGENTIEKIRRALDQSQSYKAMLVRKYMIRPKYNMMTILIENITTISRIFAEQNVCMISIVVAG